jgi:hypothetical protein
MVGGAPPTGNRLDDPSAWPLYKTLLNGRLTDFDRAMQSAVPHVPAQIGAKLQEARAQVKIGLDELPNVPTAQEYAFHTMSAVVSGYASLSQASELTGNACGFTLAPDSSVAGWPGLSPFTQVAGT